MDTIEAIHSRRSIRSYLPRGVAREIVEAIILDAAQAPTTPVSGAFAFHVIAGVERIVALGARAKQFARDNHPRGEAGYGWAERADFLVFFNAPVVIVICGAAGNDQSIQDCNRAGQNLMLSAHARGLGTCWVGSPMLWLRDAATKAELNIADGTEPFAAFTLGYPQGAPSGAPHARPAIVWS